MKETLRLVFVLTLICACAAAALSQVYRVTKGPIAESKKAELRAAIKTVLPEFDNQPDSDAVTPDGEDGRVYYIAKQGQKIVGVAFPVSTEQGYSGHIGGLVGVNPAGEITGVQILEQLETPGLGTKILEPWFIDQLIYRDEAKTERRTLENTDWRVKKEGGDIDQITGATISPRAVAGAIRDGLSDYEAQADLLMAPAELPVPDEAVTPPAGGEK